MPRFRDLPDSVNVTVAPWAGTYSCNKDDGAAQYTYYGTVVPSATVEVGAWKQQKPVPAIHFTVNNAGADQTYDGNCHLSLEVSTTKNFHVYTGGGADWAPIDSALRPLTEAVWNTYYNEMVAALAEVVAQLQGGAAPPVPTATTTTTGDDGPRFTEDDFPPLRSNANPTPTTPSGPVQAPSGGSDTTTNSNGGGADDTAYAEDTTAEEAPFEPPAGAVRAYLDERADGVWRFAGSDGTDLAIDEADLLAAVAAGPTDGGPTVWILYYDQWVELSLSSFSVSTP